ncbi:MAG: PIG-L family deacetylase [Blastocatellia bacterium]|nr:PIG-L family deacetylase [Blastocatellia bacterium]
MRKLTLPALCLTLVFAVFTNLSSGAQVQEVYENQGAAATWQAILRLRSTLTVLHTTAHPDDEDGALLAWLSRGQCVRTGLLTLNRGEGGANAVGPELYDALGILRTEELLAAGRYYGVDQMFTRVTDFGFSKRMDETLDRWGRDIVLGDVVRAVRKYRPDIIVSRFHGKPRDGHGNHQTAGLMSLEVFKASADPKMFPEQLKEGLRPWQVKKLYLSVRESEPSATLKIDVGAYDPLLGRSYREIAREGLSYQRSQGAGQVSPPRGSSLTGVQLVETAVPKIENEKSLFDGLDSTIAGLARFAGSSLNITSNLTEISYQIETAIKKFDARRTWVVAPELAAGTHATRELIEKVRHAQIDVNNKAELLFLLENKEREFEDAMNKALGLAMEVLADPDKRVEGPMAFFSPRETFNVAIPGQQFGLTCSVVNRSPVRIGRAEIIVKPPQGWTVKKKNVDDKSFGENERVSAQFELKVPETAEYTRPYWSRANELRDHIYTIDKPEYLNLPFPPPDVMGFFNYEVEGVRFTLARPAQTTFIDRPWGEQRRLLTVAPALSVAISPRVGVVPLAVSQAVYSVRINLSNNVKGQAAGVVRLRAPSGWTSAPAETPFSFTREGEAQNFTFNVTIPRVTAGADYKIQAVAEYNGKEYTEGYQVIAHRDLEPRHLYRAASMDLRGIDVALPAGLKVGYIMGVGDEVPEALEQIGASVTMLGANDLASGDLEGFDAIIVGIRATTVRDDLKTYSKRLLDYAERGGNLIYQYQTQEFDDAPYGPYPYKLTPRAEEVSEEDSKVTILDPSNPIFNWPNKITPADFDGWVEERGSKWMADWDGRYKALLECNDREQKPQRGGMLFANYGRGTFTYAAYAFYRQLPAGVPGGYRLFANIISLKKHPK